MTIIGCEKLVKTSWVYYDETYCSDPWGNADVDDAKKPDNVEKYFKGKKIRIFKVEILSDGMMDSCYSCGCKSGKRIRCKIKTKDKSEMKAVNFYE